MAAADLDPPAVQQPPPFCCRCAVHHWPDTRHYGWVRRAWARLRGLRGRRG